MPLQVPEDYVYEERMGDTLPLDLSLWDTTSKSFLEHVKDEFIVTKLQFMSRFTSDERTAVRNSTDSNIVDFLNLMSMAENIDLKNATVINAVNYIAYVINMSSTRVNEILECK